MSSEDLRERIVRAVEGGQSRNATAKQFDVSISFVVKLLQRWKQRGTIKADQYGGWNKPRLNAHAARTVEELWAAIDSGLGHFPPGEWANYIKHSGYSV